MNKEFIELTALFESGTDEETKEIKKQVENHGLASKKVEITDGAVRFVIEHYTREAGVRSLEREISAILRRSR